jgi:hypothetical protein
VVASVENEVTQWLGSSLSSKNCELRHDMITAQVELVEAPCISTNTFAPLGPFGLMVRLE